MQFGKKSSSPSSSSNSLKWISNYSHILLFHASFALPVQEDHWMITKIPSCLNFFNS